MRFTQNFEENLEKMKNIKLLFAALALALSLFAFQSAAVVEAGASAATSTSDASLQGHVTARDPRTNVVSQCAWCAIIVYDLFNNTQQTVYTNSNGFYMATVTANSSYAIYPSGADPNNQPSYRTVAVDGSIDFENLDFYLPN